MKELADKNGVLTNENKKFDKKDNESLVIFKYTATETGTWKVDFNRNLNKLKVVDETGKKILYMYEGTILHDAAGCRKKRRILLQNPWKAGKIFG